MRSADPINRGVGVRLGRRNGLLLLAGLVLASLTWATRASATVLTTVEYRIRGSVLEVTPASLSVPKGVAGSVRVEVVAGGSTNDAASASLVQGAYVEATLRGPSFPARRIVGQVNQPLLLPPLNLAGDYQLDRIRLVDSATGQTRMDGLPSSIPVHVFDQVLISQVTSRPLSLQEIQDKGIVIDDKNFRAVEFEVGFVLEGKDIPVKFPVVAPTFRQGTEIIPKAELEKQLVTATALNQQIASTVTLPPELEASGLNIQITGVNFQEAEEADQDLALSIPPIPALVVIPGNIGFLNQFFSVQIFTENGAPEGSGLSVNNVQALMHLPPGPDLINSTNYDQPGDDPLRFARVGPNKIVEPLQPVVQPGADGKIGTADDVLRLQPGQSGRGEFLVEGLQEGLHVMNIDLSADLEGLPAGVVKVTGQAAGSVLVRNPKFSLAFSHPRTIRAGEPYEADVTVLNTGLSPANLVNVTLPSASISGGVLESAETVQLGTLLPGQSATAAFHIRAQRTGSIAFSNLTTSDQSTQGQFHLSMGIDERGVALSPDSIGLPDYVADLPTNLVAAANRVLGQALSVATAGQLPPGVLKVPKAVITKRVLELAEAGQRVRSGDPLKRVLMDLALDWQGGRQFDAGFDQIMRVTDAGREFRTVLMIETERADTLDATARLVERAPDLAGRGESWLFGSVSVPGVELSINGSDTNVATVTRSDLPGALVYAGVRGQFGALLAAGADVSFRWKFTNATASAFLAVLLIDTNGVGRLVRWTVANAATGSCFRFAPADGTRLSVDTNCDGVTDSALAGSETSVHELPPSVINAFQDTTVQAGRPNVVCQPLPSDPRNYGTVLAVLFSKPMTQSGVALPSAYALENGNQANSVQIQPGARVALLNMARPVGALRPRTLVVNGVKDPRGNAITSDGHTVQSDLRTGTAVRGRVVRADGTPAAAVPVTLTYYDRDGSGFDCTDFIVRASQVFTDVNGAFDFDLVVSEIPYSVSATDTANLPPDAVALLLESAAGDQFATDKLLAQLKSPTNQSALLNAFQTTSLSQAVAQAEGLDRAVFRDLVLRGSPREGTETTVALRFRGRGIVSGQVLASDGSTPVSQAAVNLFPDPDSRELGRGIFSDANGRFSFMGVPLGLFTVQVTAPNGQARTVAGALEQVGQSSFVSVVLATAPVTLASLRGRVFESDNITPHSGARVFVGRFDDQGRLADVLAAASADADGFWTATNFPSGTYDLAAVSFDGKRKGERRGVQAVPGAGTLINISLNGRTTVSGRVEFFNGRPAPNALVAGGDTLVRTDANGLFTLTGVPTGNSTISAGVERNPEAGLDFPRLGSASLNVVDGVDNFVVVPLRAAGRVTGRVLDALGQPVPNTRVAIPEDNGFIWTDADASGNYVFDNLSLGDYTLSAPAPDAAKIDTTGLLDKIQGGSVDEIEAAFGEAARIFTGATDPFLNGTPFNPDTWGFVTTHLTFDGQTAVADIRFLRQGTVAGQVLNGQGIPIGAKVRLTGIGPQPNGAPSTVIRGDMNSDPATGFFGFTNAVLAGDFGLQAASPFFPVVVSTSGRTTSTEPDSTNNVLQFPATRDINGRLAGTVFNPDGTPAGSNVTVKISFGSDFSIRTRTNGFYDTQIGLPATAPTGEPGVGYTVEADDPATGLRGQSVALVFPGRTNIGNVQLIGKGALRILVRQANGAPATNATVEIKQGSFPQDQFSGQSDTQGTVAFQNIFAGSYAVTASLVSGPTTIFGRAGVAVIAGEPNAVTVTLGPTATLRGTFVQRDLVTPVGFAQVAVGDLGFGTTDASGKFILAGLPLGTYRLVSQDPVTGIGAVATVTLAIDGEVRDIQLVEQSRGEIRGTVLNGYGTGFVSGANVTLQAADNLSAPRTITTGPDGTFDFPGSPAGAFTLNAEDPVNGFKGTSSGTLPDSTALVERNVQLERLARQPIVIVEADGVTRAANATVKLIGSKVLSSDTDTNGRVSFVDLPLGAYTLRAFSRRTGETHSANESILLLSLPGDSLETVLRLSGVGSVSGHVFLSDAKTPAAGAEVDLTLDTALFRGETQTGFADATGRYAFGNLPVGAYTLAAWAAALGITVTGTIRTNTQADVMDMVLGASGSVKGTLVRADGKTPKANVDVVLTFNSQSGLPGVVNQRTDTSGAFAFNNVPQGGFALDAVAPDIGGVAHLDSAVSSNGQTVDLGNVLLDEEDPRVLSVVPLPSAVDVSITTPIILTFSEPLATNRLETNAIFVRLVASATNQPARIALLPEPTDKTLRILQITPAVPLLSQRSYEVVVVDGERKDALGNVTARGPVDRVGRPLGVPFVSRFTTADNDPPVLLSIFPSNTAVQVDPRSVMRLSFNEAIQSSTNLNFTVSGKAGPVAGVTAVGLNGLVLTFAPNSPLDVNATYTLTVSGVRDLAGNAAANQPFASQFTTLDTLGPSISALRLATNQSPVAGATVQIQAVLVADEPGAQVRFTQDLNPIGSASILPDSVNATLPQSGSTTFRAIATDRFGNDGPLAELTVAVQSNQAPTVSLQRGAPASGALTNGQSFTLLVSAADDVGVTNLTVIGLGLLPFTTHFTSGAQQTLRFTVPANAAPGALVQIRAQATDGLGAKSSEASLDLVVADDEPPALAILSPADGALVNPTQPLNLLLASSDNSTNYQLQVVLSGALGSTQSLAVVSAANVTVTNTFAFSLANAPSTGGVLVATARALDAASNSIAVSRTFHFTDTRPPQLLSSSPVNGVLGQSLWLGTVSFAFDEALDPGTAIASAVLSSNSGGTALPVEVSLANGNQGLVLSLAPPLSPGVTYTNTLLPSIADTSGNRWRSIGGAIVPPDGVRFTFSTARILSTVPTNGTRVVAGQTVKVTANYDPRLGAAAFRFQLNGGPPLQVVAGASSTSASIPIPANANQAVITITASPDATSFTEPFSFPNATLDVRPANGDDDGDGLPNGYEIAHGLDPFRNDAAEDPDHDGLTNLQEFQIGTDPQRADTDGDGVPDGVEVASGCMNPLNPDTDGDGIPDGLDPNPCNLATGLAFTAPASFQLTEGSTTNLVVQVASTNSPVILLDYSPTNLPPAFVSVKARNFSNTSTNGVASIELEFNPLHDAAGEHVLNLRAASANGQSTLATIRLIVADNPALLVTHWKDAADGNWSDPVRWTAGVPKPGTVGVIDFSGAYTVTVDASVEAAGVVLNSPDAVLTPSGVTFNAPVELRSGRLEPSQGQSVTFNRPLANLGTVRLPSQQVNATVNGSGRIEDFGLLEVYDLNPVNHFGGQTTFNLPVDVAAGGKFLVSTNGQVNFSAGSSLTVSGALEIQAGGRLRVDSSNPARDLTLNAGSTLSGTGVIQLEGTSRLVVPGDLDTTVGISLTDSSQVIVPGTYTIRSSRAISGVVSSSVVVVSDNAVVNVSNTSFSGRVEVQGGAELHATGGTVSFGTNVLVASQGLLTLENIGQVQLGGVLTNLGTVRLPSQQVNATVNGSGRIEDFGLLEVYDLNPVNHFGGQTTFNLPVDVAAGGKFLVSTNGQVNFSAGSSLTVSGALEIQAGGRLRVDSSNPARDLALNAGSTLGGTGVIQLEGTSRLVVPGDLDTTVGINLTDSSQVIVPGTYTIRSSRAISGVVSSSVVVVSDNAVVSVSNTSFSGRVEVQGGAELHATGGTVSFGTNVLVASQGLLTLENNGQVQLGGVLTNLGTVRLPSQQVNATVNGSGRIEDFGLLEVYDLNPVNHFGGQTTFNLPVDVAAGGKFLVSTNGQVNFSAGSSLTVSGALEIQAGGRLRVDSSNPARDLTLNAGSTLSGTGVIQLEGTSRLVVPGDLDTTVGISLTDSSQVIVPGTYTIRSSRAISGVVSSSVVVVSDNAVVSVSNTSFSGRVEVQGGAELHATGGTVSFGTNVLVASQGLLTLENNGQVQLGGVLTNLGTVRLPSQQVNATVNGSGRIEDFGLLEVYDLNPVNHFGGQTTFNLPVDVAAGGKFLVSTNGQVNFSAGSSLTVSGALEIQAGGRLRVDSSNPARDLTLNAGSTLSGTGVIQLEGTSRLVVPGDLDTTVGISLTDSSQVIVPGTYTIRSSRAISGVVSSSVVVVSDNAVVNVSNTSFSGRVEVQGGAELHATGGTVSFGTNVLVASQGLLTLENNGQVQLGGVLTNLGTVRLPSQQVNATVNGSGRIEDFGLLEVYDLNPVNHFGGQTTFNLPVDVAAGGKFLVSTNGQVSFSAGSSLTVSGALEIQDGARFQLDGSNPPRDLTLNAGSTFTGNGTVQLDGSNRFVVASDFTVAGTLNLFGASSLFGTAVITIAPNGVVIVDHSTTFAGSLAVQGKLTTSSAQVHLGVAGTLTLEATGSINNPGTITTTAFVNHGGVIVGNPPQTGSVAPAAPQIQQIRLLALRLLTRQESPALQLNWSGPPDQIHRVEVSADFRNWQEIPADIIQTAPGQFDAVLLLPPKATQSQFLRVKCLLNR